ESDVFEIVLPITVFVLSDDDFFQEDAEEQAASVPELKAGEQEADLNNRTFKKSNVTPSNDSNSLRIWEENKSASSQDNSMKYSEEKWVAESVCNRSKSSLSDWCDSDMDK
ncbi:hypothetical protein N335_05979, partial [Phaethon lepturus]